MMLQHQACIIDASLSVVPDTDRERETGKDTGDDEVTSKPNQVGPLSFFVVCTPENFPFHAFIIYDAKSLLHSLSE
jgi:hypothetical protein